MKRLFFVVFAIPLFATTQNSEKLEKKAVKYFYTERHVDAFELYQQILSLNPQNELAKYRSEICYLLTDGRSSSLDKIIDYGNTQGRKDKFYHYWMGRIHFGRNDFQKAINSWNTFLALKNYRSKEIIAETEGFIKWAELAEAKYNDTGRYEIEHLNSNINSEYIEYSPVYFKEKQELLFLSSIPLSDSNIEAEKFHVFRSKRNEKSWSEPEVIQKFGDFISTNANIEVVANNGKLFLYKDEGNGSLYYSQLINDNWTNLSQFDSHLSGKTMDSHFFINEHEDRILFAAPTRKGAYENFDIFESIKDPYSGKWLKPERLSKNVNSNLSEDYPYLTADDKTLYFSSKGHESLGGYDIFKSDYDLSTATWSEPEPLGYPINTQDDDIQFKIDIETNSGYFVSDRFESNGGFDIFFFHSLEKVLMEGLIVDIKGLPVINEILEFIPENVTNSVIKVSTDAQGRYSAKLTAGEHYNVVINFGDKLVYNEGFRTPIKNGSAAISKNFNIRSKSESALASSDEFNDPVYEDLQNLGSKFRLSNRAILTNIYFQFGSLEFTAEASESLGELFEVLNDSKIKVEISGHTDNIGPVEANLQISKKRAEAAQNYLVRRGIDKKRLVAKGHGPYRPLASNDDAKDGRELNRRIEIMVLE